MRNNVKAIYKRDQLKLILVLAIATLAVYLQTTSFSFITYDDPVYVTENVVVQKGLSLEGVVWAFTGIRGGAWMPVTWLSHMLDCQFFGLKASGHHLVNVLYHLANSILLFLLLNRLTAEFWKSTMVAALFALHPLHVESVAWIAERRDVLSLFLGFLSIMAYMCWLEKGGVGRYLLLVLCFIVGLASKPMLVTIPVLLLLMDFWPLRRLKIEGPVDLWGQWSSFRLLLVEKIPLFSVALASGFITVFAEDQGGTLGSLTEYPLSFRVGNAVLAYVRYLGMTFWPLNLLPYYPFPKTISFWLAGGALLILTLISIGCYVSLKSRPYLAVGWLWFIITLLPVIGIIQQGSGFALADRYTYLPLIGLFIMVAWGGGEFAERWGAKPHRIRLISVMVLAVMMVITFFQVGHWRDTTTLFSYTIALDPENKIALSQLGVQAREQGNYPVAYRYLNKAAALYPDDFEAQGNQAKLLWLMGRNDDAIRYFAEAMRISPKSAAPYADSGIIKAEQGDFAAAIVYLEKAIALRPNDLDLRLNLALVFYRQGKYDPAAREFSAIIQANPGYALGYNGLGLVYLETGRVDEAVSCFRTALRLDSELQIAKENLKTALSRQ